MEKGKQTGTHYSKKGKKSSMKGATKTATIQDSTVVLDDGMTDQEIRKNKRKMRRKFKSSRLTHPRRKIQVQEVPRRHAG